jgi:hypothetical protein
MPKSRKRKPPRKADRKTGRRRIATLRPGQDLSHLLTEDDHELMRAEIEAGARGDALAAFNLHEAGLQVENGLYRYMLRELVILGEEAPPWMYSRWCLDLGYRWMLCEEDPRIEDAVRQLMVMSHWPEVAKLPEGDGAAICELGNRIAGGDRLCQELALHEYGGIYDFIDVKAQAGLLDRCDHIVEWAIAELGGYVIKIAVGHCFASSICLTTASWRSSTSVP